MPIIPEQNWFADEETKSNGRLKFIPCPHSAEAGYLLGPGRFVTLVDDPKTGAVIMALCPVCKAIIIGALVDDVIERTVNRVFFAPIPSPVYASVKLVETEDGRRIVVPDTDEPTGHPI